MHPQGAQCDCSCCGKDAARARHHARRLGSSREFVEALPDGVVGGRADDRIEAWNAAVERHRAGETNPFEGISEIKRVSWTMSADTTGRVRAAVTGTDWGDDDGAAILSGYDLDDEDPQVRAAAATNRSVDANDRRAAVVKEKDPQAINEMMARGPSEEERGWIARAPGASTRVLTRIAADDRMETRVAVANHPNASARTLDTLSKDDDYTVRAAVARHPERLRERTAARLGQDRDLDAKTASILRKGCRAASARMAAERRAAKAA